MANSPDKIFFLRRGNGKWEHVSKQDWVRAERAAGFVNTLGKPDEPGTASFSNGYIEGRTVYVAYFDPDAYGWDPGYRDAVAPVVEAAKIWFDPKWEQEAKADWLDEAHKILGLDPRQIGPPTADQQAAQELLRQSTLHTEDDDG